MQRLREKSSRITGESCRDARDAVCDDAPRQQECVVSAIPEIGHVVVKNLLRHFGTVAAVMGASREELMTVELVGPKTADRIREVVGGAYKE